MEIDQDFSFGFKDELIFVDDLSLNDIREEEVIAVQDIELSEDACVGDDASKEGFTSNGSHDPQSDLYQESQPETYECGHCSKKFNTRAKMLKHYQLYHQENVQTSCDGKRSWSCSQCDKQFASRKGWIIHQRSHSGEKPYTCLICGKSFIDSSTLMKHQVIHQDTRPFTCNVCGHGFNQKVALQRHEKTHNQVQEFQCGFCPKTFLVKCSLEAHEKSHTGEKLFLCKYCSRAFHTVRALKQHKRVHMIEQPPTCLQCKEEFLNLDTLLEHMEIHAASPNLQCPLCSMRFNETVHLKEHIRIHVLKANERFCNLCQMVFHSKEETILHFNEHIKVGFRRVEALGGGVVEEWGSTNEDTDTYKDIGTNNDTDNMDIGTNNDSDNRDIGTNNDTDNVDIGTNNDTDNVDIGTNNDTDNVDIGTNNDTDNMDIGTNNDSDNRDIDTNNDTDNMDIVTNNDMDNMDIGTNNDTDNMDIGTNKDTDTNKNIGKRVDVVINGNKISENDEVEDGIFYENDGILLENSRKEIENSRKEIKNITKEVENVRKEVNNSSKEVENSMKEIENVREEVKNSRKEVEYGRKEVENSRKEVENNKKEVPRDLGKNVDLVRNNIDNNQSQSKVLLSIKRSIEYIPDQILDIIGRNPEKSNNGTANGTTIEKSKNGIANGTSIEKSKNGTATGTTIEKSKNGTTIDDLVVIDHNRKDSSNISKEIVTKVPSTQNSVEGIQNRKLLESVLELHSQQPDDNVTNSKGHLKPGGVRKTSLKVLKKKTFTKYYKKNSIQIIVKKKSSAQESVENVVDENVTETHNVVSKKNKSLANENVEKLANNSMTDTSNIVSKKKKNNCTKKHKDNDQSREGIIYYAPNSVEEHKNCNHQFLSYVEEGVQRCNLYCDSSTSFVEDNSRNKAMEEALNGVDNKIVKESTIALNETDSQGNNYSKNDKGLVEEFSRESVIKLATIEGRVVENVQKSGNVLGLQEIEKALESKKVPQESEKVSQESKQVSQESKKGSQESEPVLFKSKKVSQESKKVTLVIKKVLQESKTVSQENKKVSQESKPISKDMSFQGTNSKQKSSVKPSKKQKVVEPDIEEKVEEVLQRIMEECRSFEEANKQNRTEFSGLEALCDVAESAAKELNQVENFMIKESVNCQDSMVAKSPRNETSQTPCLNDIRFFCKSCNRTYSSSFDFREHRCSMSSVRTKWTSDDAEGSKRFTCSECNKSFRSKNGFLIHRRSHTGERPYPCRWCEKAFGDSGTRHKHERIHTGERPFHCSNCPRAFNQRAALRAHQVTHAKCVTRSYMCALCPSSFTYFANLRRHVLVCHRDSNAICCPLCTFPKMLHYDMESLKEHVEDVHCTKGQKMRCFICDQNEFEDLDDFCCHISGHSKFLNGAMHNNNNDCLEEDSMEEDLLV